VAGALKAQPGYTDVFDQLHVNRMAFTIPTDASLSVENAYVSSSLHISYALEQLSVKYNQLFTEGNAAQPLSEKKVATTINAVSGEAAVYLAEMRIYSPVMVGNRFNRMLIIRPADGANHPCILVAHGSRVSFNSWATFLMLGIPDYLMRGYAVAIYEEWNSTQHMGQLDEKIPAYTAWENAVFGDLYTANAAGVENDDVALQRAYFLSLQYAHAAATFLVANAGEFNINAGELFSSGHSAGGLASLMLAFADSAINFDSPSIRRIGTYGACTYEEMKQQQYSIRGVASSGAGLPDHTSPGIYTGKFIDPSEQGKVVVMLHGKNDPAAPVNNGPGLWNGPVDSLRLLGPLSLKKELEKNGVVNYSLINCTGEHGVYGYPLTAEDNSGRFKNLNPALIDFPDMTNLSMDETPLHQLLLYCQQVWDMQWVVAGAFYNVINDSSFRVPSSVFSWKTGNYSNPMGPGIYDWHFVSSSCGIDHAAAEKITGDILSSGTAYIPGDIQFSLRPSLATTFIEVAIVSPYALSGRFHIWDLNGNLYYRSPETDLSDAPLTIDVSTFPNGMYVASFVNEQGNDVRIGKFVVLK